MDIHTAQSRFVAPLLGVLKNAGAPLDKMLARAELSGFNCEDPNTIIPLPRMLALIREIGRQECDQRLPVELVEAYRLDAVPGWGDALLMCPDILSTIQLAVSPQARIMSHNFDSAGINGPCATYRMHFTTPSSEAQEWVTIFSVFLAIDGFRAGCGEGWLPDEIDISASNIDALADVIDLNRVIVRTNQPTTCFRFPSSVLRQRMRPLSSQGELGAFLPLTVQESLYQLFASLDLQSPPSLVGMSHFFDISPRSLQRRLHAEGSGFRETLDNWRMTSALSMIEDPRKMISEIAARLHYSDTAHFTRAFHRWTGVAPTQYRDQLALQSN